MEIPRFFSKGKGLDPTNTGPEASNKPEKPEGTPPPRGGLRARFNGLVHGAYMTVRRGLGRPRAAVQRVWTTIVKGVKSLHERRARQGQAGNPRVGGKKGGPGGPEELNYAEVTFTKKKDPKGKEGTGLGSKVSKWFGGSKDKSHNNEEGKLPPPETSPISSKGNGPGGDDVLYADVMVHRPKKDDYKGPGSGNEPVYAAVNKKDKHHGGSKDTPPPLPIKKSSSGVGRPTPSPKKPPVPTPRNTPPPLPPRNQSSTPPPPGWGNRAGINPVPKPPRSPGAKRNPSNNDEQGPPIPPRRP